MPQDTENNESYKDLMTIDDNEENDNNQSSMIENNFERPY